VVASVWFCCNFFLSFFKKRKRVVFRISDTNVFLFFLKILSLFLQNWQEINLPGNPSLREKTIRPHTQATSHQLLSHPKTLHPHLPPKLTLVPHTRTHLSHLPPHNTILQPPPTPSARRVRKFCAIVFPKFPHRAANRAHAQLECRV